MSVGDSRPHRVFQLVAGHPVLDFINTLDHRFRPSGSEELLESYGDLVRFTEQTGLCTPQQAAQLLRSVAKSAGHQLLTAATQFRENLAQLLYADLDDKNISPALLQAVEKNLRAANQHRTLAWNKEHAEWIWSGAERRPEFPLWLLALSASDLVVSPEIERLKACDSPECRWLFLDVSKNHTRRWCDMKLCGNRMKARRFKERDVAGQRSHRA